ncbi:PIG-L family deacetylase [Sporolactobacillus shoreicorticis]|uniref:PIG-L deacetylase family protein n=1 Tax=Sporolactobacillus shoreicorticis TaxID=1923877 RepID=A0ABW5S3R3_9BACL|nr:PIG-L deacetylase family protein [Sporolactobacillus shoreicorticis]MCO7124308.1 PIG-L family deacetylase [Sporolactobacillus shoreicorticis]
MGVRGKKAIVFIAHPDDETFISGTLAKLVREGNKVLVVIATNGDKGTHDRTQTPEQVTAIRQKEMGRAANVLGVNISWLNFSDGTLFAEEAELKERVFRKIRLEQPDLLFTFDPFKKYDVHSDHMTIGRVASEAGYLADGFCYYPEHLEEGIEPSKPQETYLFNAEDPNYSVTIRETFDLKVQSAEQHVSQFGGSSFKELLLRRIRLEGGNEQDLYLESFYKLYYSDLLV